MTPAEERRRFDAAREATEVAQQHVAGFFGDQDKILHILLAHTATGTAVQLLGP